MFPHNHVSLLHYPQIICPMYSVPQNIKTSAISWCIRYSQSKVMSSLIVVVSFVHPPASSYTVLLQSSKKYSIAPRLHSYLPLQPQIAPMTATMPPWQLKTENGSVSEASGFCHQNLKVGGWHQWVLGEWTVLSYSLLNTKNTLNGFSGATILITCSMYRPSISYWLGLSNSQPPIDKLSKGAKALKPVPCPVYRYMYPWVCCESDPNQSWRGPGQN